MHLKLQQEASAAALEDEVEEETEDADVGVDVEAQSARRRRRCVEDSDVEECRTDAHSPAVGPCHQGLSGFECCKIHGSNRYCSSSNWLSTTARTVRYIVYECS